MKSGSFKCDHCVSDPSGPSGSVWSVSKIMGISVEGAHISLSVTI